MRIDRFFVCVRLVKSRAIAKKVIESGHVRIDGRRVGKASEDVKVGSTIGLALYDEIRVLRILRLPKRRGPPAEAQACYEELRN